MKEKKTLFDTAGTQGIVGVRLMRENKIICGDCLEVMKEWPDNCVDLVLTDPPYGIDIMHKDGTMGGTSASIKKWRGQINHSYPKFNDKKPISTSEIKELQRVSKHQIIWGGNYIADNLSPSRCWLIWNKRIEGQSNCYGDCELAWSSLDKPIRIFHHLWMGMLRDSETQEHYHATQKPVELGLWCLQNYSKVNDLILDAYCGGGAFCVAAKMLGRRYIGIDISEKYCEIARQRLEAVDTGVPVKEQDKGQQALFPVNK